MAEVNQYAAELPMPATPITSRRLRACGLPMLVIAATSTLYGVASLASREALEAAGRSLAEPTGTWSVLLVLLGMTELVAAHAVRRQWSFGRPAGAALSAALLIAWFVAFSWSPLASVVLVMTCGLTLYALVVSR